MQKNGNEEINRGFKNSLPQSFNKGHCNGLLLSLLVSLSLLVIGLMPLVMLGSGLIPSPNSLPQVF